jgi:hypothetical protein
MSEIVPNLDARELCEPYEHLIRQALAHSGGTHWYEDILYEVQKGNMFFWPAKKSCMITEVVQLPRKRVFHVFLAAGELHEIKDMESSLVEYAKALECDYITLSGRKGWGKALKDLGYKISHYDMAKEIN